MKLKYVLILACLSAFSSCVKVEDDTECGNSPAPSLLSSSYTLQLWDAINVAVVNPNSNGTYTWTSPGGDVYSGPKLNVPVSAKGIGEWKVAFKDVSLCQGISSKFTVNVDPPSCGLTRNSFKVGNASTESFTYKYDYDGSYYYSMYFEKDSYDTEISFLKKPTKSAFYTVTTASPGYIDEGECMVLRNISYYDYYKCKDRETVYVTVNNGTITVDFCDAKFYNSATGQYLTCKGRFTNSY